MSLQTRSAQKYLEALQSALPSRLAAAISTLTTEESIALPAIVSVQIGDDLARVQGALPVLLLTDTGTDVDHYCGYVQDLAIPVTLGIIYQAHSFSDAQKYARWYTQAAKMAVEKCLTPSVIPGSRGQVESMDIVPIEQSPHRYLAEVYVSVYYRTQRS